MRKVGFTEEQWLLTLRVAFYLYASSTLAYLLAGFTSKLRARSIEFPWKIIIFNPLLCSFFSVFVAWGISKSDGLPLLMGGAFAALFVLLPAFSIFLSAVFSGRTWVTRLGEKHKNFVPALKRIFAIAFAGAIFYLLFRNLLPFIVVFIISGVLKFINRLKSSGASRSHSSSSSGSGPDSSEGGGSSSSW